MANVNYSDPQVMDDIVRQLEKLQKAVNQIQPSLSNSGLNGPHRHKPNSNQLAPKSTENEKIKKTRRKPRSKKNNATKSAMDSDDLITPNIAPQTSILRHHVNSDIPSTSKGTPSINKNVYPIGNTSIVIQNTPKNKTILLHRDSPTQRDSPTHKNTTPGNSTSVGKNTPLVNKVFNNYKGTPLVKPKVPILSRDTPSTSTNISSKYRSPHQREKRRNSNSNASESFNGNKLIDYEKFAFKILPAKKANYTFVRKRNSDFKYINLRTFRTTTERSVLKPCVFTTNNVLTEPVPKMVTNKKLPKVERRKYSFTILKKNNTAQESSTEPFAKYFDIEDVTKGLDNGTLIKGFIRINPKNCRDSYVNNENTSLADYYLTSVADRNRALEGDEVVLQFKKEAEWLNGQKTARVVYIKKQVSNN